MKKIMWIAAMIPVVVTSVVLQFMPDVIPMHHDLEGNTDRWGSKTESLIFPVIILLITLFWHLLIHVYEKKSVKAKTEKEQMEAKSSAKVLCIVGLSQAVMFGIMHYFILYSSWIQADKGSTKTTIDISKVSCILLGIMFIVLGNYITKAKRNAVVGLRTAWSMHNDNTWRKSNRFAAICIIITGLLTIITTVFTSGMTGTIFMLIYLLLASIVAVIYSKKVYDKEKPNKIKYDKTNKKAVLKCSICTGEQVAGFKDIHTGHFDEIMLIRNEKDLDAFMEMYDIAAISKEY